jgi:hypothetical protein
MSFLEGREKLREREIDCVRECVQTIYLAQYVKEKSGVDRRIVK